MLLLVLCGRHISVTVQLQCKCNVQFHKLPDLFNIDSLAVHLIYLPALVLTFRYRESDLIRLDIQINGDPVEPLSTIVHKDKVTIIKSSSLQHIYHFLYSEKSFLQRTIVDVLKLTYSLHFK